ncbi:phage tail assembly chaperone [Chengkuizengella sp. SCS-71B]|uniref:phage tail assembly chaperone n=1 Tax=Chengkuizengella sp. SCS-71B TaxID=3115290 RepID=UPI0032C2175E
MQAFAYGILSLKPQEFWSLTLAEYNLMIKGYELREEQEWRRTAQLAAWVMSPHLKRPITADKLFKKKQTNQITSPEQSKQVLNELMDEFGIVQ